MLTRLVLFEIAGNTDDIVVDAGGPSTDNGLFAGWITRGSGHNYKPLISTNPVFKTAELAKYFMQQIVEFAKKFTEEDLGDAIKNPGHPLHFLTLNNKELGMIQDIVAASKIPAKV
ncbi:MAG: hypothetical protein Q8Q95_01010 [bacterium]|nr:hypothetical protein [bacterium]